MRKPILLLGKSFLLLAILVWIAVAGSAAASATSSVQLTALWNTLVGTGWSPAFSPAKTSYTTSSGAFNSVELGYDLANPSDTVKVNGVAAPNGGGNLFAELYGLKHGRNTVSIVVTAPGGSPSMTYTVTVYYLPNVISPNGGVVFTTTPIAIDLTALPSSGYTCYYTITAGSRGAFPTTSSSRYTGTPFTIRTPGTHTVEAAIFDGYAWSSPIQATFTVTASVHVL